MRGDAGKQSLRKGTSVKAFDGRSMRLGSAKKFSIFLEFDLDLEK
ncbi:hypothetical protein SDC9_182043 [bioreactor metagenome]|uniref:Uncharacterized protein n=1 Tax=bioreactor metagenome TaxID=1076179 RepID=A0A645H8Y7_9ZZZZ